VPLKAILFLHARTPLSLVISPTKYLPSTVIQPSPPLARVHGWTFRCWHPSCRFHHDGALAADFTVAQRSRFLSLRYAPGPCALFSLTIRVHTTFAHLNPPFAEGFRIDVRSLDAAAPNSPRPSRNHFSGMFLCPPSCRLLTRPIPRIISHHRHWSPFFSQSSRS
jgi:hypothetical protein